MMKTLSTILAALLMVVLTGCTDPAKTNTTGTPTKDMPKDG